MKDDMAFEKLSLDYQQVHAYWRTLADIRFKLLAIVPTLAGIGVSVLADQKTLPGTEAAVGFLGFLATLGITFYDQRNTQHYNDAIKRAKKLEVELGFKGGIFAERPPRSLKLFDFILMWHDRGLCMVYSSALGAWFYVIVDAAQRIFHQADPYLSLSIAITIGLLFYRSLIANDEDIDRLVRHKVKPAGEGKRSAKEEQHIEKK